MIGCFYLPAIGIACELARVPAYRDQPLALASSDNVICAVSEPAATCGISVGMTITAARSLCRGLVVLPYHKPVYEQAAEAVWDAIATESSVVEPVAPELCFAWFDKTVCLERIEILASLLATKMGVGVSVGLASSKLVAEQASKTSGRAAVIEVQMGMEAAFLASVPLSALKQIETSVQTRLERLGVRTLGDILRLPKASLGYQFRAVSGLLCKLAVGDDYNPVKPMWPPPKIVGEYHFDEETAHTEYLRLAVQHCATSISRELCDTSSYSRQLTLSVRFDDRSSQQTSERLRAATHDQAELHTAGMRLLGRLSLDRPVSDLCLTAGGLGSGSGTQLSLLESEEPQHQEYSQRLDEVMAYLREKFGFSAVVLASLLATTRQVELLTYPLGCKKREAVLVATNREMEPVRFYRRQQSAKAQRYEVLTLHDHWQATQWTWDQLVETDCYRVLTEPNGLHQLEKVGLDWKLTATAD